MARGTKSAEPSASFLDRFAGVGMSLGLLLIAVGLGWWFISGATYPPRWAYAVFAVGVLLLMAMASSKPELLRAMLPGRRQLKYGSNAFASIVLLFIALSFLNYLTTRYKHRFDLTKNRSNTLSPQTIKILREKVKGPLHITYYYAGGRGGGLPPEVQRLLRNYEGNSRHIRVEFVDVITNLQRAKQDGVFGGVTTILKYPKIPNAVDRLTAIPDESAITGSILKLTSNRKKRIYFMQGHGERSITGFDEEAMSSAKSALEKLNYKVESLPLLEKGSRLTREVDEKQEEKEHEHSHGEKKEEPQSSVIHGVDVLVIAGPRTDLNEDEDRIVRDYLDERGKLLLLLDPPETRLHHAMPRFQKLVTDYGGEILPGILATSIVALTAEGLRSIPEVGFRLQPNESSSHFILKGVPGACAFYGVLPMKRKATTEPGQTYTPLFQTSERMMAASLSAEGAIRVTGKEPRGPFDAAFAVEQSIVEETRKPRWRMVVVGDSDWASNRFILADANQALFTSIINWLSEEEAIIDIPAKPPVTNSFGTGAGADMNQILRTVLVVVIAVPLGVLVFGTMVWWQRR
ncbi:MAG: GldG family protein [Abditibacteriales bacterium]|nr:GldG family protein [Abditibacteriales bacterium]MDW8365493.1 Gldg family protein [Abditibacteriales bacterium]